MTITEPTYSRPKRLSTRTNPRSTVPATWNVLAADALIYLEAGADEPLPALPEHWLPHRDKRAGQVAYRLFRREAALSAAPRLG